MQQSFFWFSFLQRMSWVNNAPYTYRQWRQINSQQEQLYYKNFQFYKPTNMDNNVLYDFQVQPWNLSKKMTNVPESKSRLVVPMEASTISYCTGWTPWFSSDWIPINCSQIYEVATMICQFRREHERQNVHRVLSRSRTECSLDSFAISSFCLRIQALALPEENCPNSSIMLYKRMPIRNIFQRYMRLHNYTHIGVDKEHTQTNLCLCFIQSLHGIKWANSTSGEQPLHRSLCLCHQLNAIICTATKNSATLPFKRYQI